MTDSYIV